MPASGPDLPGDEGVHMPRLLLVLAVLAVVIFLVVSAAQRRGTSGGGARRRRGPTAPDDDPQFLRDLDDRLWRDRRRRGDADGHDDSDSGTG